MPRTLPKKNQRKVGTSLFLRVLFPLLVSQIVVQLLAQQSLQPLIQDLQLPLEQAFWTMVVAQAVIVLIPSYLILRWQLRTEARQLSLAFDSLAEQQEAAIQTKEELILGVSHELRSPLASLESAVEMLDDEKRKSQLRLYCRQMKVLLEELLDSHQVSSDKRKLRTITMDVVPFIKNIIHLIEVPNREINFTYPQDEPVAEFDGIRMEKVIRNLLENALRFSDPKSPISIELIDQKDEIKIIVMDRGPGIPSEEIGKIFQPFYRVEKSRGRDIGGYGLGLFLCKKIVEAHRGRIWVENRREGGAVFSFVIPKNATTTPTLQAA